MDAIELARQLASQLHADTVARGADPWDSYQFVLNEAKRLGLYVEKTASDATMLNNARATFIAEERLVLHEFGCSEFEQAFLVAHEIGHVVLGDDPNNNRVDDIEPERSADPAAVGMNRVNDYSHRQRREVQMDLFAREFLLPRTVARSLHLEDNLTANDIATRLGAPFSVVAQQLLDALLLPVIENEPVSTSVKYPLNKKQQAAVGTKATAFLLEAGPGTGKTQTLVGRVEWLLKQGVDPRRILLLTFSNKAAAEMARRIADTDSNAAAAMWIGTFHSFGLDLIRRFHAELGLPKSPRLMDRSEAVGCLEEEYPRFDLTHYRDTYDPTQHIADILNAISRAKDEVVDASAYAELAKSMLEKASSDEERVEAEKAMEVATVYAEYESLKSAAGCLDFGDLVMLPVKLLEEHGNAVSAQVSSEFDHILVDEYQDVNRSSVRLLRALHQRDKGGFIWVVGDAKQSIYRFRGASSFNVARFTTDDFPHGKRGRLTINYRSVEQITDTFSAFAQTMKTGGTDSELTSRRGQGSGAPEIQLVSTADQFSAELFDTIEAARRDGYAYRDQVIICRGNEKLSMYSHELESLGVPILFLGSLFERSEIKDLMALLQLLVDRRGMGLLRVATLPGYSMSLDDVSVVMSVLSSDQLEPGEWLNKSNTIKNLTAKGDEAVGKLAELLSGFPQNANPWDVLSTVLLDRTRIAASLCQSESVTDRTQGIALWQFLNFIRELPSEQGIPIQRLGERIRRMLRLGDDRELRQLPQSANSIDAVRVMTIHGAKGLEFPVVHFPGLNKGSLPKACQMPACLPPAGMIQGYDPTDVKSAIKVAHEEEEACLFYVALSRAKDRVVMYAALKNARGNKRALSPFVEKLGTHFSQLHSTPTLIRSTSVMNDHVAVQFSEALQFQAYQLALYERCPRRFFYTHIARIGGRQTSTPYMKIHDVVRQVVSSIVGDRLPDTENGLVDAVSKAMMEVGLSDERYAQHYRGMALTMANYLLTIRSTNKAETINTLSIPINGAVISVKPDDVQVTAGGHSIVRFIKTGHSHKQDKDDLQAAALLLAAQNAYPSARVEYAYLSDQAIEPLELTEKVLGNREDKIKNILNDIRAGHFPAKPSDRVCPKCPAFFICGSIPSGSIKFNLK